MVDKIKIDGIKFTYSEGYLPTPRCRKLRYRDAAGETSAEVTLLTEPDKDAPVAFRFPEWRLTQAMGKEYYGDEKDRVSKEIRLFGGKLYERDHNGNHFCHGQGWYNLDDFTRDFQYFQRRYSYELGKCPDTLEEYQEAIRLHAESVILMHHGDGVFGVWIECGEPRYVYNTFGLGHNHGGTGLFIEQHFNPNIPNTHYFSALERDRAIEAAVDAAMRRGDDQSVEGIRTREEIEVLIPEAVKVNLMQQHGEGDQFINSLNALTEGSGPVMEAGILALAFTAKEVEKERGER